MIDQSRLLNTLRGAGIQARAIRGSTWALGGAGVSQVIRLGSNLVLTRLLYPEAFGLMLLVQVVVAGLGMLSDVGIRASIIRHERGEDRLFLDTAWTVQAVRGALLWVGIMIIAYPAAMFYEEPTLLALLPIVGARVAIRGLASVNLHLASRNLNVRILICIELVTQVVGVGIMIALAWLLRSVWALVLGGLMAEALRTALSHRLVPGPASRFRWDRAVARDIYHFGRWILVSTCLTFLLNQGDRLILGKFMSGAELGVYAIAVLFPGAVHQTAMRLNRDVLFPVFAQLVNYAPNRLRKGVFRARLMLIVTFLPILLAMTLLGEQLIHVLYDIRYAQAGWMLQVLSVGMVGTLVRTGGAGGVLLAQGDSLRYMILQVTRSLILVASITIGGMTAGVPGVIVGFALSRWLDYPVLIWAARRAGVWMPALDGGIFILAAAVAFYTWYF